MNKKKIVTVITALFFIVFCGLASAYIIFGNSMADIKDEKSISDYLAVDKNEPITILEMESYEDYVGILYTDPFDKTQDDDYCHFVCLKRHKWYKNKYVKAGSVYGNFTETNCYEICDLDNNCKAFFIFDIPRKDTEVSVFETDGNLNILSKIEEISVPQKEFIILKKYKMKNSANSISIYNGSIEIDDLERENK